MTMQFSVAVRNARLDAIETAIGASAVLKIRSGTQPANVATADSGTVLSTLSLPSDWMAAASAGAKAKAGTWEDLSADATGYAGHWRAYASDGTTCHAQGPCAQAWAGTTAYEVGHRVVVNGNVYVCTAAGTSASSGGPTGTGTGITDGGVTWNYVQPGVGVLVLNNTSMIATQTVTVTGFTITDGNA